MKLWHKVLLGLILGVLTGVYFPHVGANIKPVGDIFLRLIQMMIVPVIFFTLVSGITSMNNPASLSRIGIKATIAYLATTVTSVAFGLLMAVLFKPGIGVNLGDLHKTSKVITGEMNEQFDIVSFFVNIVPKNSIMAFAEGNVLQVVFFAIFTGIAMNKMGSKVDHIRDMIHSGARLVLKMITMVVELSPYGAYALTAWVVSAQGIDILYDLMSLVGVVSFAMALQYLILILMIFVFAKLNPMPFIKKSIPYQMLALSTSSSKATLPTTMQVCREDMGISETSTSFVLPLGASINMDGLAINLGLCAMFFAQVYGVDLSLTDYIVLTLTATLGSIGGAGIPGASLIMLPMVLSSINVPYEGVAILAGVDRILDALRTTVNITGDATITLIVDESEGLLDKEQYYKELS
jgi:Na+/H+-dicarboxylate symporter